MSKPIAFLLGVCIICSCHQSHTKPIINEPELQVDTLLNKSYAETKILIDRNRVRLAVNYLNANGEDKSKVREEISGLWISAISNDLFKHWSGTPWDFNGVTLIPKEGTIACGFFVTTILQDMALKLNRTKLSICAASEMMKSLAPQQEFKKLNDLTYNQFCDSVKSLGKGVYIIGLDFHVGLIVNDSYHVWFIHSNYINRKGVTKETVQNSIALQASKTRWLISLTNDQELIEKWLKGTKI